LEHKSSAILFRHPASYIREIGAAGQAAMLKAKDILDSGPVQSAVQSSNGIGWGYHLMNVPELSAASS